MQKPRHPRNVQWRIHMHSNKEEIAVKQIWKINTLMMNTHAQLEVVAYSGTLIVTQLVMVARYQYTAIAAKMELLLGVLMENFAQTEMKMEV